MVLVDVTNIGPHIRHSQRTSDRLRKLIKSIQSEYNGLLKLHQETDELRLRLQIRHCEYLLNKKAEEFQLKQQNLFHSHLQKKAELVSAGRIRIAREQESYKARIARIRHSRQRKRAKAKCEGKLSMQQISKALTESNHGSLSLLKLQLEDTQAVIFQTIRSLQSQVQDAVQWNRQLEETIAGLHIERSRLRGIRNGLEDRFREAAQNFTDRNLQSQSLPKIRAMIERCCQKSGNATTRAKQMIRRNLLKLKLLRKQIMIYQAELRRAIFDRDELYDQFVIIITTISEKNRLRETEVNERIFQLSQKLVVKPSQPEPEDLRHVLPE